MTDKPFASVFAGDRADEFAAAGIPFRQRVLSLTVSIGICHRAGRDLYALLSEADRQLYLAKAAGRNRVALQSHVPA